MKAQTREVFIQLARNACTANWYTVLSPEQALEICLYVQGLEKLCSPKKDAWTVTAIMAMLDEMATLKKEAEHGPIAKKD